jgi:hypothetical protein
VQPSPAERFHLEQEYRQQQIWAWRQAEAALLNAKVAAQMSGDRYLGPVMWRRPARAFLIGKRPAGGVLSKPAR